MLYALKQNGRVIERFACGSARRRSHQRHHGGRTAHRGGEQLDALQTLQLVENFLSPITLIEFASDDAIAYATVRAKLERADTPIGPLDTLLAAQHVGRKLTLVTNNEREFRRVRGLWFENWIS